MARSERKRIVWKCGVNFIVLILLDERFHSQARPNAKLRGTALFAASLSIASLGIIAEIESDRSSLMPLTWTHPQRTSVAV
jgi:hypothetical protein